MHPPHLAAHTSLILWANSMEFAKFRCLFTIRANAGRAVDGTTICRRRAARFPHFIHSTDDVIAALSLTCPFGAT